MRLAILTCALLAPNLLAPCLAKPSVAGETVIQDFRAPSDAIILIIRHAEKPAQGSDLSAAGRQHALAYVSYFKNFTVDSRPFALDALYATADSKGSSRPRLTLEPLSRALHLKINNEFKNRDFAKLAAQISSQPHEKRILICWHHGEIPALLGALGADPARLLPGGAWPPDQFGWVLELRYDHDGRLIPGTARRIDENIKPAQ